MSTDIQESIYAVCGLLVLQAPQEEIQGERLAKPCLYLVDTLGAVESVCRAY